MPAPARLWATPERAEPGAGGIEQDPVGAAVGERGPAAVRSDDKGNAGFAHQLGPVRLELKSQQPGATGTGDHVEEYGLAARARAEIDPQPVRALKRSGREGKSHQLTALVLDTGAPVPHRRQVSGRPAIGEPDSAIRPRAREAAGHLDELSPRHPAGHQVHLWAFVVCHQSRAGLVKVAVQGVPEGLRHPAGVAGFQRDRVDRVRWPQLLEPAGQVTSSDLA